ncbi:GNAT family N-acetyltransferase [Dictyobacter kobayashii]|uniref:Acetyltransferase n=1 Tax=Dictyobacter kobayashii TaxID=2014872 RepID=A0A402APX7_9CHLR|nr:GNAT family N-acetyltransferase [Dictyobacter kobayashii]GCE21231.1 acetyltransferase [Dictyobacter kobayashii]
MQDNALKTTQHILLKNNLQLILRPARPEDAEPLLAFVEQIAGESENITFGPGEFGMSVEEERAFLRQVAMTPTSLYLIAEIDGEIAGTLTFSTGKRPRIQHAGEFGISILRKYWNLGIGSQLLAYLIAWAGRTTIIRKINLRVRVDNLAAIHLYEKFGFAHEGRISREFHIRGQFIDAYHMGLALDPSSETATAR